MLETKEEGGEVGDETGHAARIGTGLTSPSRVFRFYPPDNEEPLKDPEQRRKVRFVG